MSWTNTVAFSFLALNLAAGQPPAPAYCDAELLHAPKSAVSYQLRGDRCEGIYAQQVSTVNVDLRSFVKGFGAFDPETQTSLELAWKAPPGVAKAVRLRAFSLRSRTYFRMDTAQPIAPGSYRWPTEVLAGQRLGGDDLGILAWVEMPGPEGQVRKVYLPLRAGAPPAMAGYSVTVVPSKKLKKILLTVVNIDDGGNEAPQTGVATDLGGEFAYYPSNQPTVITTGAIGEPGFYRLKITAMAAAGGDAVIENVDFYHSGD